VGVAQDNTWLNHAAVNPYLYNPSLVSVDARPSIFVLRRQQWTGIDGAPVTNYLSFQSSFGRHVLFGTNIVNDTRGLLGTTSVMITGGFRLPLAEEQSINFAITSGIGINSLDFGSVEYDYLESTDDPAIFGDIDKSTFVNGNAGISYQNRNFYVGMALPQIFENKILSDNNFDIGDFSPLNKITFVSSILLSNADERLGIQPFAAYHHSKYAPDYFEAALIGHFYKTLTAGVSYRHNVSFSGILGVNIKDHLRLGYSYEINTNLNNEIASFSYSTHEFSVGIFFGKKKLPPPKPVHKRSNFQRSTKERETVSAPSAQPTQATVSEAVTNVNQKETAAISKYSAQDSARLGFSSSAFDVVNTTPKRVSTKTRPTKLKKHQTPKISYSSSIDQKPQKGKDEVYVAAPGGTDVVKSTEEEDEGKDAKPRFDYRKEDIFDESGKYVGPKQIQKGNHLLELNTGYYVVVGVFREYRSAEAHSDQLFDQGFYSKYGYASQTGIYFVYTFHSSSKEAAIKESMRLKAHGVKFKDVWVLTIE